MEISTNGATTSSAAVGGGEAKKNSKKPKYSRFTQQELPACKPIVTPGLVVEIMDRYDETGKFIGGAKLDFSIPSLSFFLLYVIKPRPLGDPSYLSWNKSPSGHPN
ncbi:putative Cell division control protein [Corchorus olitorius]|uniref:Cell division control protein n=1 Tax=Corchorus olitorius TaxID=93759 RepID=A0A1R3FUB4_9ROSI|nr:putative Cell division control protein [Corchorus olitorius]